MSQQPQFQQGGQSTGNQQWTGQGRGGQQQYAGRLSGQERGAIQAIARAIEVCEWCADQCIQEANPNMVECIRLCEDVAELGEATLVLTSRNSRYGQSVAQSFQQAVQACAQECSRHQRDHCQECAQVLSEVSGQVRSLAL